MADERDYTEYRDKEATPLQQRFGPWLIEKTGYNPAVAKTKQDAFDAGVRLAVSLRIPFQASPENREATEELRKQREEELATTRAQREEERLAKAKEREDAAAVRAAEAEERRLAKLAKAAAPAAGQDTQATTQAATPAPATGGKPAKRTGARPAKSTARSAAF